MKILVYDAPKTMRVDEAPDFPLGENDLRVQTLYSHEMLETCAPLRDDIGASFPGAFDADGQLDRRKLGQEVFSHKDRLEQLNSIIFRHLVPTTSISPVGCLGFLLARSRTVPSTEMVDSLLRSLITAIISSDSTTIWVVP